MKGLQYGYHHKCGVCAMRRKVYVACRKMDHFACVCWSKNNPLNEQGWEPEQAHDEQETAGTTDMTQIDALEADLFIGMIHNEDGDQRVLWHATFKIQEENMRFKLGTGTEANLIPRSVFDKLDSVTLTAPRCCLVTYSCHRIPPDNHSTFKSSSSVI